MIIRFRAWWYAAGLIRRLLVIVVLIGGIVALASRTVVTGDETEETATTEWVPPTAPTTTIATEVTAPTITTIIAGAEAVSVSVQLSPDTGQPSAEVAYLPSQRAEAEDNRASAGMPSNSTGGTGIIVEAGECGFDDPCWDGLPQQFDLVGATVSILSAEQVEALGPLPNDSGMWFEARRECYETVEWYVADCNLELARGQYGVLGTGYAVDSACLSNQYRGRMGLVTDAHPDADGYFGWWNCLSEHWDGRTPQAFWEHCTALLADAARCAYASEVFGQAIKNTANPLLGENDETAPDPAEPLPAPPVTVGGDDYEWERCNASRYLAEAAILAGVIQPEHTLTGRCETWRAPPLKT